MRDGRKAVEAAAEILRCARGGRLAPDNPTKLPYIILLAWYGYEDAHRALCGYAGWLADQGKPLPHGLQTYIVFAASDGFKKKKRFKNLERDLAICIAVREVKNMGYDLTRNEATTQTPSACSLVAEALREFGQNMTDGAVVQIIKRRGKDILNEPSRL